MVTTQFTLSIVSHGQSDLVGLLLDDLKKLNLKDIEIIVTMNIPEDDTPFYQSGIPFRIIKNARPLGFGENHNNAFKNSHGLFFVVVNPDIRINSLNLNLFTSLMIDKNVGAIAPVILNNSGSIEDSARFFPTSFNLLKRFFMGSSQLDYKWSKEPIKVNWVAGMFIVFRSYAFRSIGGFDQKRFFMYFEDVDICKRLWSAGWSIFLQPQISVIHNAQRASRKNLRHFRWHIVSAIRYLTGL